MKFEKLTDTQIKIILSLKDIESNNLSLENVLSNSANSQKLLETMINQAEKELDFHPDDSKLLVEATSSNEECIFTITKLSPQDLYPQNYINSSVFQFENFDDFINLCQFLNNLSYLCLGEISKNFSLIYYNYTYYLKFTYNENHLIAIEHIKPFFGEFANDVSHSPGIEGILNEYGKIIFEKNAILKCLNSFEKS